MKSRDFLYSFAKKAVFFKIATILSCSAAYAESCSIDSTLKITPISSTLPAASIYQAGTAPKFSVQSATSITVSAIDYWGNSVSVGSVSTPDGENWTIALPPQRNTGYFELHAAAGNGAETGCVSWAVVSTGTADPRFGINTQVGFGNPPGIEAFVRQENVGAIRDSLSWAATVAQPAAATTIPASFDTYMQSLATDHIAPLLTLAFGNPAFEPGGAGVFTLPFGNSAAGQTDIAGFAQYGATLAERYAALEGGRLSLAVWNEVNGSFCQGPACATARSRAQAYTALAAATATVAGQVGGMNVPIVGGATYGIPLPWFESLLDRGIAGACPVTVPASTPTTNRLAGIVDALDIHWYGRPEDLPNQLKDLNTLATSCTGARRPIVATEFGSFDYRDSAHNYATATHQNASAIAKQAAVMVSQGVNAMYWYVLSDRTINLPGDPENLLWSNDGGGHFAPNPAYAAYANLINQLRSFTPVLTNNRQPLGSIAPDSRTQIYPFSNAAATKRVYIAWATPEFLDADIRGLNAAPIQFVTPAAATITDLMGRTIGSYAAGTTVSLSLTTSPVYIAIAGGGIPHFGTTAPALLASSFDDFGLTYPAGGTTAPTQPQNSWSYGAILAPSGDASAVVKGTQAGFTPMTAWLDGYWGTPAKQYFSLTASGQEPVATTSGNTRMSMWAVRRWTCPATGPDCVVAISGQAALSSANGVGTRLLIIANDTVIYEGDLIPQGGTQPSVSIETAGQTGTPIRVKVAHGAPIDFAVTTGPISNGAIVDEFDYTSIYAWISAG